MENKRPATHTYTPAQLAVLPGAAGRGLILGLVYLPMFPLLYLVAKDGLEGTGVGTALQDVQNTLGWGGIAGIGFVLAMGLTLFVAWLGYRSRSYEIGPDGITSRRGVVFETEKHLAYDEFEGVSITESFVQSLYGAGTVLITDINQAEDQQTRMKMSYVRNPEDVSTMILRQLADRADIDTGELDAYNVEELDVDSKSISRLDSDALAAGTGFEYMMPDAILHPRPEEAAKHGIEIGLLYSLGGAVVVYYYLDGFIMDVFDLPSVLYVYGITALGALVFSLLLGAWYYSVYDDRQYELYNDHITFIEDDKTTSYSLDDIYQIEHHAAGLLGVTRPWSDVGHIALQDEMGDDVIEFEHIASSQEVLGALEEWLDTPPKQEATAPKQTQ
jgi:hypothetical protein